MEAIDYILITVAVIIITYIGWLKHISVVKFAVINVLMTQLNRDYKVESPHDLFPAIYEESWYHIYLCAVDVMPANVDTSQHTIDELYNKIAEQKYTVNQIATLILQANGYQLRTIYGRCF